MPKYKPGDTIGGKLVLEYLSNTGKKEWYRVRCKKCGREQTVNGRHLKESKACRQCNTEEFRIKGTEASKGKGSRSKSL